jgi:hypothetical protein
VHRSFQVKSANAGLAWNCLSARCHLGRIGH